MLKFNACIFLILPKTKRYLGNHHIRKGQAYGREHSTWKIPAEVELPNLPRCQVLTSSSKPVHLPCPQNGWRPPTLPDRAPPPGAAHDTSSLHCTDPHGGGGDRGVPQPPLSADPSGEGDTQPSHPPGTCLPHTGLQRERCPLCHPRGCHRHTWLQGP